MCEPSVTRSNLASSPARRRRPPPRPFERTDLWSRYRDWPRARQIAVPALASIAVIALLLAAARPWRATSGPARQRTAAATTAPRLQQGTTAAPPATAPTQYVDAPRVFSGVDQSTTAAFPIDGGMVRWAAKYEGSANFIVEVVDASDPGTSRVMINGFGAYVGSGALHLPKGSYVLRVDATGPWQIATAQPRVAPSVNLPQTWSARQDGLVGPYRQHGAARVTATHDGRSLVIQILDEEGNTAYPNQPGPLPGVVNAIGPYSGTTALGPLDGVFYVAVTADGAWTITIS